MSDNQRMLIDTLSNFKNIVENAKKGDGYISDFTINLSYSDFMNALSDIDELALKNCLLNIDCNQNINDIIFKCKLTFSFCTFIEDFDLKYLFIENDITFDNCRFNQITFIASKSDSNSNAINIHVSECYVQEYVNIFHYPENITINLTGSYNIYDEYCFSPIIIHNTYEKSLIYKNRIISKCQLARYNAYRIECYNCIFEDIVSISNNNKSVSFNFCTFRRNIYCKDSKINTLKFIDSTLNDKLLLYQASIDTIELINCSFENTVKIINIEGTTSNIKIEQATIKGMFIFNASEENKEITMKENTSNVSFSHIFLEPTGYLIIRKIKNGSFNFDYANILGHIVMQELDIDSLQMHNASIIGSLIVQDIKLKELDLKNTSLIGKLVFNPSDTLNIFDSNIIQNRETAYLLKKGKQEEGDSISASHFKRKELQLYLKDCTSNFNPNKMKECIVLFFNKTSNDFGQSWVRGIIFTMSFAYIFYLLINFYGLEKPIFRFAWSLEGFGIAWKEYLKILNVLNFNDKLDNFKFTPLGDTLFFVSKIFVSYGIYQTVSAFRKFGK